MATSLPEIWDKMAACGRIITTINSIENKRHSKFFLVITYFSRDPSSICIRRCLSYMFIPKTSTYLKLYMVPQLDVFLSPDFPQSTMYAIVTLLNLCQKLPELTNNLVHDARILARDALSSVQSSHRTRKSLDLSAENWFPKPLNIPLFMLFWSTDG